MWDSDEPVPRAELLKGVQGAHGLLCLLSDKIDTEVLDAAGTHIVSVGSHPVSIIISSHTETQAYIIKAMITLFS